MLNSKNKIVSVLKNNKVDFQNIGIKNMFLFGSYANGNYKKNSDIDILIEIEKANKTYSNLMYFKKKLKNELKNKIDVVFLDSINPVIYQNIKKELIRIE